MVFCLISLTNPHMLLLDEPTNHLDMECIDSLAECPPAPHSLLAEGKAVERSVAAAGHFKDCLRCLGSFQGAFRMFA